MAQFLYRLRVCYFIMATLPQDFRFFPEPDPIIELLLKPLYFGYKCLYPLSCDTVTRGQVFYLVTGSSLNDLPLIRNGKNNVT